MSLEKNKNIREYIYILLGSDRNILNALRQKLMENKA